MVASGLGAVYNQPVVQWVVWVCNLPEPSIQVRFNGHLGTHQKWLTSQRVHLWICIMLLFMLFENSKLQKFLTQHPVMSF
jgi:hypothetical protein